MSHLVPHVIELAFKSLSSWPSARPEAIRTIQGLLLLCAWPAPVDTRGKDISQVFSSTALQLAIRNGLHVSNSGQEFSRTVLDHSQEDPVVCARLWSYCLIICQRYFVIRFSILLLLHGR